MSFSNHNPTIAIIGLGYVGLPLAVAFAEKYTVVGFDIHSKRVDSLMNGIDDTLQCSTTQIQHADKLVFTHQLEDIAHCQIFIVTVPTPVDAKKQPNLNPLLTATQMLGGILKKGISLFMKVPCILVVPRKTAFLF